MWKWGFSCEYLSDVHTEGFEIHLFNWHFNGRILFAKKPSFMVVKSCQKVSFTPPWHHTQTDPHHLKSFFPRQQKFKLNEWHYRFLIHTWLLLLALLLPKNNIFDYSWWIFDFFCLLCVFLFSLFNSHLVKNFKFYFNLASNSLCMVIFLVD